MCRDFAHLAIAFCRCMNIPARYCTGYLGDIGVPPSDAPMDFAAGSRRISAATGTRSIRATTRRASAAILIARGRDAADVAISTAFGPNTLKQFKVWTDEVNMT